jgi:hypothetical protein
MLSTAFMGIRGYSTTLSTKIDKIDCSQVLKAVLVADKQFLGHIKMGPAAQNIEHNWLEDQLNPAYVMCSGSANNRITISTGYGTASLQRFLRKYTVLQPSGKENVVNITQSVTSRAVTVAAYGSTTWASWTMTKAYIVAQPWADIDSASSDMSGTRPKRKNFTQVFERAVEITQTRKGISMEAVMDELQLQIKYRTLEVKSELDRSIIMGYARTSGASTYTGLHELRTMAGVIQLIRDYDLDATNEDDTVINASSSALTLAGLNSLVYKLWDKGGFDETSDPILLVGMQQARVIAGFEKELRRVEQGERQVGYYRNVFLSDAGFELPIVMDRWVPKDKLLIVDRNRISLLPLAGDNWHLEKMAKTGRNEKWQLSGQFTIEMTNTDKVHGLIYNLT